MDSNQSGVVPSSTYNKEQTLGLYRKRKTESEEAKHLAANLEGKIESQMKAVKMELSKFHPRIIEHYGIKIPLDLSKATADDIITLRNKIIEVENAIGLPVQNYLETGNKEYLMKLPQLEDLNSLTEIAPTEINLSMNQSQDDRDKYLTDV